MDKSAFCNFCFGCFCNFHSLKLTNKLNKSAKIQINYARRLANETD